MDLFAKCTNPYVDGIRAANIYPYFHKLESRQDVEVIMEGKRRIMLGSNNYLGLTTHPRVIEAGRKAMSIHSFASLTTALDVSADYLLFGDGQRIFDVDTPAHHNNQLMEIAAELNPSQRDHVLEILEVMVPYIKN